MSDDTPQAEAAAEDWSDVETSADGVSYPSFPENPHNHRFTVSFDGRGPMVVVRGNTAAEVIAGFKELEDAAAGAAMGNAWASLKAAAAVASGLGATPVAPGAPATPQAPQMPGAPTPPPFGPNVSVPGAPGFVGNPGFTPPPAPAAQPNEYAQKGWYRLDVPFVKKGEFEAICGQYQMRKGRPSEGGQFSFNKGDRFGIKGWHVDPQYAGAFPMFGPVPA